MRFLLIAWNKWKLDAAREELIEMQSRFDVGPTYLVNTLIHINALERRVGALRA